jgi:hypothetical protein
LTSLASSGAAPAVTVPAPVFTAVAASVPLTPVPVRRLS